MLATQESFQESEELIRTLYVQNNYTKLLQLQHEFPALCNQDAEKAALFLPLLVKAQIAEIEASESWKKQQPDLQNDQKLFELHLFILKNVQMQLIPISMMMNLFKLRDHKLLSTQQIHALLDEYLLGCLKAGIHCNSNSEEMIQIRSQLHQERQSFWRKITAYLVNLIPTEKIWSALVKFLTNAKVYPVLIAVATLIFAMKRRVK
jgi:hypothetical protein